MSGRKRGSHALSDSILMSIKQQGCRVTAEAKARGEKGGPVSHDRECAQEAPCSSPKNVEMGRTGPWTSPTA